jgi:hypothetical protein
MPQTASSGAGNSPYVLSLGILAWNEEGAIAPMLESLFRQTIFSVLAARGGRCEVVCLANGCTDGTTAVARGIFERVARDHPDRGSIRAWVADIPEPGRNNAWNRFVREYSCPGAGYIALMDADIIFDKADTIELVLGALERDPRLGGASDWPVKDMGAAGAGALRRRLSLATSDMTGAIAGRLNGMFYCLRAEIARNLYFPRDLGATDDGFIKAAICTDFFREPLDPARVVSVRGATHLYQPYLTLREVINNQKRQMIGQTSVHVLIEHMNTLTLDERAHLGRTLRDLDERDPDWLRRLIGAHVDGLRSPWGLFPGLLAFRWRRLSQMKGMGRITHFPAAAAGFCVTVVSSWLAFRFLRGGMREFWPKVRGSEVLPEPQPSIR